MKTFLCFQVAKRRYITDKFQFLSIDSWLQDEVEDERTEDHEYSLESENMEEHKSLILHLLSKLKLGMDLTKVC